MLDEATKNKKINIDFTGEESYKIILILKEKSNTIMKEYQKAKNGEKTEHTLEEYGDELEFITKIIIRLGY
jgi:hypothetical protein